MKFDLFCKETNYIFAVQFGKGIKKIRQRVFGYNIKETLRGGAVGSSSGSYPPVGGHWFESE
ncbi:MAG: hypothetical protein EAS52_04750 [Parapedobacter sp.]|nr:MAG: hypothetical protein EAS52_04750 [Parapedobacter sp.]